MKPKVYIDGKEGTTGLQIYDRLAKREDIELLLIDPDKRKDVEERTKLLNEADLVFLCLPDQAAREAVKLVENPNTCIIDASTAHRIDPQWTYGFSELSADHREKITRSKRVANPGCHASGFISGVYPLVQHGVIAADTLLTCYSLTGYTGGGKSMIAQYQQEGREHCYDSCRIYGLTMQHKHLPEMQKICGLDQPPMFAPVVGDYAQGMATTVLLPGVNAKQVYETLAGHYHGQALVSVAPPDEKNPMIYSNSMAGLDTLRLVVYGHEGQAAVTAVFDNLGKGASGAAVQNMNLMLGFDQCTGLNL